MKNRNFALVGAAIVALGIFSAAALPAQADSLTGPSTVVAPPAAPTTPTTPVAPVAPTTPVTPPTPVTPVTPTTPVAPSIDEVTTPVVPAAAPSKPAAKKAKHTAVSRPVPRGTRVSSGWGHRHAPCWGCTSFHKGLDFNPGYGKPIRAIASGVVTVANSRGQFGVHVTIKHTVDGKVVYSGYAHMKSGSMHLRPGQHVKRGQLIGRVGTTGASTGAHLHFTIKRGGKLVDPAVWLRKHVNH